MSDVRLAEALSRLDEHHTLHLPLRRSDLLGRLALRFLWRRQLKWQMDVNLATRDAVDRIREILADHGGALNVSAPDLRPELAAGLDELRRADANLTRSLTQRLHSAVGGLRTELSDLRMQAIDRTDRADELDARIEELERRLDGLEAAARRAHDRHVQLDLFLDQARLSNPPGATATAVADRWDRLDVAVCELVEGPPEVVRERRAGYLPLVEAARGRGASGPVFDAQPGRGEWLEALAAAGIEARAATPNPLVARRLTEGGLAVSAEDPFDALAAAAERSLGAVTAFRFVERLESPALARFVDLAARALQPGGVLVVETPNPASAAIGDFHLDPFAARPVHPAFLRFLASAAGFTDVEIRYVEHGPVAGWPLEPGAAAAEKAVNYCLTARR